ncbi:hypothetical protein JTB14_003384 [Gonioctena quinquepunctata]|nr:hypothetical protein JTB14_003384 [Gonioctena quinquepunctata]
MSRGRKRKSQKGLILEEDMKRAVRQALIGEGGLKLSLRKAATYNGISFQTLQRYVKKEREKANPNMKSNYKQRLIFNEDEERALKNLFAKKRKFRSRDISSDEDSGEEEREISLHDDLDEDEWVPEVASSSSEELNRDPEPTDFVLVQFKAKKDMFYIGKVMKNLKVISAMEVVANNYMPGDSSLVEQLVYELKSQGIFDRFRKECIADVDTKPAYQNLRQRVEGSVVTFLRQQTWSPDMNKNQVREQLRKNIYESGYLETGVERIVDQVVNPKINTVFLPQVEDVVYRFLGVEKPIRDVKKEVRIDIADLLPTDLEAVSPESVHSFKDEIKPEDNSETLNDSLNSSSKPDEDESPPFEPLDTSNKIVNSIGLEENSIDSHLSGFSGLQSHGSNHSSGDNRVCQMEISSQDSQTSQNSSETRLSIITSEDTTKMNICEDTSSNILGSAVITTKNDISNESKMNIEENLPNDISEEKTHNSMLEKKENDTSLDRTDVEEKKITKDNTKNESEKSIDGKNDKSEDKRCDDRKHSKISDKKSRSSDKHISKDRRDDKNKKSSSSSSRDKDKSNSKYSSSKDRDRYKDKERSENREKHDTNKEGTERDKEKNNKKKILKRDKISTEKKKTDKDSDKSENKKEKSHRDKEKSSRDKQRDDKDKSNKEKDKSDREKSSKDKFDKERSDKHKHREKDKNSKEKSSQDKEFHTRENDKDKVKSSTSSSKNSSMDKKDKSSSSLKKESSSSSLNTGKEKSRSSSSNSSKDKSKAEDGESKPKSSTDSAKNRPINGKHSSSSSTTKKDKDRKRDSKRELKDDHYSSKDKKTDRRSTDRDSNDGQSSKQNCSSFFSENNSSRSVKSSQDFSSTSGSGDSGNSDQVYQADAGSKQSYSLNTAETNSPVSCDFQKLIKPKFALNFKEARKIMKIRKQLAMLERQNQLGFTEIESQVAIENGLPDKGKMKKRVKDDILKSNQKKVSEKKTTRLEEKENVEAKNDLSERIHTQKNMEDRSSEQEKIPTSKGESSLNKVKSAIVESEEESKEALVQHWESTSVKRTELSQENWEALEARLAQEMSTVNYNCYESEEDNYSESPEKKYKNGVELEVAGTGTTVDIHLADSFSSEDSVKDLDDFKGFNKQDADNGTLEFFKKIISESIKCQSMIVNNVSTQRSVNSEEGQVSVEMSTDKSSDEINIDNVRSNETKRLLVVLKENNITENKHRIGNLKISGKHAENCLYLEKPTMCEENNLDFLHGFIAKLEEDLCKEISSNPVQVARSGRKRKLDENVDLKNNNKAHYEQAIDIPPNESFSLPLSPAESDKSNDKKEDLMIPTKRRKIIGRSTQRYSSEDLYKPRTVFCRRSKDARKS